MNGCFRTTALRASRSSCRRLPSRNLRFQSSSVSPNSTKSTSAFNLNSDAVIGGVLGGSLVFLGGYAYYHFSGAKTFVNTAHQTKAYFEKTLQKTKESAPQPNEAIQWLRETALSYASIIPGARGYVNSAFNDLDTVHEKHREEVDKIVMEAYDELKDLGSKGFNMATVATAWEILQKHLGRIGELAKEAGGDILSNHPQLRERYGGEFNKLKQMADNYGPEAKKQFDETWNQLQDALKGGFSTDTFTRVQNIIQEATQKLQRFGDEAWQKGMEQAKPYLDKSPKVKELVEQNKDKLKQGNVMELVQKLKDAFSSGKTEDLEKYVHETANKATSMAGSGAGGLEKYFNMIPGGGGAILSNLSQLQEGAQKHGQEAEKLLKEAVEEIQQVLSKKVDEGKKLADKVKRDSRK